MKIKRATQTEVEYFAREERKLVEQYAARDEDGNVELKNGRFVFPEPEGYSGIRGGQKETGDTETDRRASPAMTVEAPKTITPAALEALSVFIRFKEGGQEGMRLPAVQYADGIRQGKQDQFKGLNHNLGGKGRGAVGHAQSHQRTTTPCWRPGRPGCFTRP